MGLDPLTLAVMPWLVFMGVLVVVSIPVIYGALRLLQTQEGRRLGGFLALLVLCGYVLGLAHVVPYLMVNAPA